MHSEFEKEGQYKFTNLKAVTDDLLAVNKSIRQLIESGENALKQYLAPKYLKGPFESLIKRFIKELTNIQERIGGIGKRTEKARLNYEQDLAGAQRDLKALELKAEQEADELRAKITQLKGQKGALEKTNETLRGTNTQLLRQKEDLNRQVERLGNDISEQANRIIFEKLTVWAILNVIPPLVSQFMSLMGEEKNGWDWWIPFLVPFLLTLLGIIIVFWIIILRKQINERIVARIANPRKWQIIQKWLLVFTFQSLFIAMLPSACQLVAIYELPNSVPESIKQYTLISSKGSLVYQGVLFILIIIFEAKKSR